MFKRLCVSTIVLGALCGSSAFALTGQQKVEREIVITNPDGSQKVVREQVEKMLPGDKVVYTLDYFNEKDETVSAIKLVMPVPTEVAFIEGSADTENVTTQFSADNGKTFAARDAVFIRRADGTKYLAAAEDITHIRWTVNESVAPQQGGSLSFSARLK